MFIPGSHRKGALPAGHDTSTTSYPLWTIDHDAITKLVAEGGIVAPKGPPGSMILFHGCLVHASTSNLSPWNRVSVYLSLCAVSNHIRRFKRPEYIAHRDFTPIRPCRTTACCAHTRWTLPWKDGTPASAIEGRGPPPRRGLGLGRRPAQGRIQSQVSSTSKPRPTDSTLLALVLER
jgi:ectoine hydroxylase